MDLNGLGRQFADFDDYRSFLNEAMTRLGFKGERPNYAAFARKAGFASRSFPRDVVVGKRRLTAAAVPKFVRGMGLRGDLRLFFEALVALEESGEPEMRDKVEKLRGRLKKPVVSMKTRESSFARYRHWPDVFASLGDSEKGASVAEIARRTGLAERVCREIVEAMLQEGVVRAVGERFRGIELIMNFEGLGRDVYFRNHLQARLQTIHRATETELSSEARLLFDSVWSIDPARLPELKRELRTLLQQFIKESERPEGDALANLFVSLGPLGR